MSATPIQVAEVKTKTVPQLKALLTAANLPITGLKQELIDRVLANAHILGLSSSTTVPVVKAPIPTKAPDAASAVIVPTLAPAVETEAQSAEDIIAIELKKREERAKRFGISGNDKEENTKLLHRAKKFGDSLGTPGDPKAVKGLDKLDQALGSGKKGKGGKAPDGSPSKAAIDSPPKKGVTNFSKSEPLKLSAADIDAREKSKAK